MNTKTLVAYFSASGVTAKVAKNLADAMNADLYEIRPEIPYTTQDLDWTNKKSRSSIEMNDKAFRPAICGKVDGMEQYSRIFIGFPIWWYVAPTIINTFLEAYDLSEKTVIPFATSGSSNMGKTNESLKISCTGASLMEGRRFRADVTNDELKLWVSSL